LQVLTLVLNNWVERQMPFHSEWKVDWIELCFMVGYFEDRRPASNMDPYVVTSMIANTTIMWKPEGSEFDPVLILCVLRCQSFL
jgi:hypothetical protein